MALTGFEHPVFVQSGTAALKLAISVLTMEDASISAPALACWAIPAAVLGSGRNINFDDVDDYLGSVASGDDKVAVYVDPWGAPSDWVQAASCRTAILDATLAPGASLAGADLGRAFDAIVFSLGRGKPLDVGAGGVVVFRDTAAAAFARRYLLFGVSARGWDFCAERYVFAPALFPLLNERLAQVEADLRQQPDVREDFDDAMRRRSIPLRLARARAGSTMGWATIFAAELDPGVRVPAPDLMPSAMLHDLPAVDQWISPAYLQPAAAAQSQFHCPSAEHWASRLLFFTRAILENAVLDRLAKFFDGVLRDPGAFCKPYRVSATSRPLPQSCEHWSRYARVARRSDGTFFVFDQLTGKFYKVDEEIVSAVQAAQIP